MSETVQATPLAELLRSSIDKPITDSKKHKISIKNILIIGVGLIILCLLILLKSQDCEMSDWTPWSACDDQTGTQIRTRSVIANGKLFGTRCRNSNLQEIKSCSSKLSSSNNDNNNTCQVEWSSWSSCDENGGSGTQTRKQMLNPKSSYNDCPNPITEIRSCQLLTNFPSQKQDQSQIVQPSSSDQNSTTIDKTNTQTNIDISNLVENEVYNIKMSDKFLYMNLACDGSSNGSILTASANPSPFSFIKSTNGNYRILSNDCTVSPNTQKNQSGIISDGTTPVHVDKNVFDLTQWSNFADWTFQIGKDLAFKIQNVGTKQYLIYSTKIDVTSDSNQATSWVILKA